MGKIISSLYPAYKTFIRIGHFGCVKRQFENSSRILATVQRKLSKMNGKFAIQSNFNGSNIFGTIELCSRYGYFEPLRVIHGARSGSK